MYNVRDPYSPSTSLWSQLIAVFCSSFLTMCSFFRTALSLHKLWCPVAGTWVLHHPSGGPHHEGHHPVNPHHDGPHQQGQHPPVNPLWPTNPLEAGRKLSMLVKASQWVGKFPPNSWMGHLDPNIWSPTFGSPIWWTQVVGSLPKKTWMWYNCYIYTTRASCKQKPCLIHSVSYE